MLSRKPRSVQGQTIRSPRQHRQTTNPILPSSSYTSNIEDLRLLHGSMRDSLIPAVETILAKDRTIPPPPLPQPTSTLGALPLATSKRPENGLLPGLGSLPAADAADKGDTFSRRSIPVMTPQNPLVGKSEPRTMSVSPRRESARQPGPSPPRNLGTQAALAFLSGTPGKPPSGINPGFPEPQPVPTRTERHHTQNRLTHDMTQPTGGGTYCGPNAQFAKGDRGLDMGIALQREKFQRLAQKEAKAQTRRNMEANVVAQRLADGEQKARLDAARCKAKAAQYDNYIQRLSEYKFTR